MRAGVTCVAGTAGPSKLLRLELRGELLRISLLTSRFAWVGRGAAPPCEGRREKWTKGVTGPRLPVQSSRLSASPSRPCTSLKEALASPVWASLARGARCLKGMCCFVAHQSPFTPAAAIRYFLKDELMADPSLMSIIGGLHSLAWSLKPAYGLLSDTYPIFGSKVLRLPLSSRWHGRRPPGRAPHFHRPPPPHAMPAAPLVPGVVRPAGGRRVGDVRHLPSFALHPPSLYLL